MINLLLVIIAFLWGAELVIHIAREIFIFLLALEEMNCTSIYGHDMDKVTERSLLFRRVVCHHMDRIWPEYIFLK